MTRNFNTKIICCLFMLFEIASSAQSKKFKVVVDAGHGGGDAGTMHNGYKEKNIVLSVALKLGKLLENEPGVDVVYTRKTDVFIELRERANIANRADADLFVSIHCNGVTSGQPYGTETFVMGLTRSNINMEVARKENSVITLEKDYKVKYKGFDPNAPETSIGLKLAQEEFIKQSLVLAVKVQDGFTKGLKRYDRGVKQIPLWVLDASAMPGILIELGFVSNKNEVEYLNSDSGQDEMAQSIANAIVSYKNLYYRKYEDDDDQVVTKPITNKIIEKEEEAVKDVKSDENKGDNKAAASDVIFKIQISASSKNLETKPSNFKGLKNISKIKEGSLIKYYYGETTDYNATSKLLSDAKAKGFGSAYVVPFKNGKIITMKEALK